MSIMIRYFTSIKTWHYENSLDRPQQKQLDRKLEQCLFYCSKSRTKEQIFEYKLLVKWNYSAFLLRLCFSSITSSSWNLRQRRRRNLRDIKYPLREGFHFSFKSSCRFHPQFQVTMMSVYNRKDVPSTNACKTIHTLRHLHSLRNKKSYGIRKRIICGC